MAYLLTDGENFIRVLQDKPTMTTDASKATTRQTIVKANNYKKVLPALLRSHDWEAAYTNGNYVKEEEAELGFEVEEFLDNLEVATDTLEKRLNYLYGQQSKCDLERTDIEHAAEFYKLNAAQGYKLYKLLHENGIRRRKIKDEIKKIEYALNTKLKKESVENSKKRIEELNNQQYTGRILKELFGQ